MLTCSYVRMCARACALYLFACLQTCPFTVSVGLNGKQAQKERKKGEQEPGTDVGHARVVLHCTCLNHRYLRRLGSEVIEEAADVLTHKDPQRHLCNATLRTHTSSGGYRLSASLPFYVPFWSLYLVLPLPTVVAHNQRQSLLCIKSLRFSSVLCPSLWMCKCFFPRFYRRRLSMASIPHY